MVFSFLYLSLRALLGALLCSRRVLHVKDIELRVLRHELEILRRQVARRGYALLTGPCSQRQRFTCRARCARHGWSLHVRCFAGIGKG